MRKIVLLASISISSLCFAQLDCNNESTYTGEGTYYFFEDFGGFGNCSFDDTKIRPFLIGAMNEQDYAMADYCGACVDIDGPEGSVRVQLIDRCPECKPGDIDLSPEAFDYLAPRIDGRIPISWKVVPCEVTGPVVFYYKDGSNQWWTAVQIRNHRNQIKKLEFWDGTKYVNVPRQKYNYFLKEDGMGVGPHKFRITDMYGNSIVEENISFTPEVETPGVNQFPVCVVTGAASEVNKVVHTLQQGDELTFAEKEGNYQLIDVAGKVIQTGLKSQNITTQNLQTGIYILKMMVDEKLTIERVFVR